MGLETRSFGTGYRKIGSRKILVELNSEPEKWCPQCRKYWLLEEFSNNGSRYDGHQSECKRCQNATNTRKRLAAHNLLLAESDPVAIKPNGR